MNHDETEPTPDLDDLLQEPVTVPTVPVHIEGQVLTHELPSRRVKTWTDTVTDTAFTHVLYAAEKRKRGLLISVDEPVYFSTTGASNSGSIWPKNVPYEIRHAQDVYVRSATGSATTKVGITVESWAD